MNFRIEAIHFHVLPMRTRFPFRYGIAAMTALPHLLVRADLVVHGRAVTGQSADGLPPKWFTKDPDTPFEADLAEMIASIQNAARIGRLAASNDTSFFSWWKDLHDEQASWSSVREVPSLLAGLGMSLIERAVLDALCRAAERPLWRLLHDRSLGIELSAVRDGLPDLQSVVANPPRNRLQVRHTVGLADPLRDSDIPDDEWLDDGLPQSLEASIRHYGLRSFKVKLSGDLTADRERLTSMAVLVQETRIDEPSFTLDGNEHFTDMAAFQEYWTRLAADPGCAFVVNHTRFIEQPLHRNHALTDSVGAVLQAWSGRPPVIIDESDGSLADLPRALELGYGGTSHKNCKGIVKGLANAALIRSQPRVIQSGEDLANVGPVALLQDLAVMALLGIDDIERNGHHYFRGLSMHTPALQAEVTEKHGDLYRPLADGTPALDISQGCLLIESVNRAPFGCDPFLQPDTLEPLKPWIQRGGLTEF